MGGKISLRGLPILQQQEIQEIKYDSDEKQELTEQEKRIVRSQWPLILERSNLVCIDIFHRIFELKPETKSIFPFKNAEGEELLKHPYFRGHITRFLNAVRMTVVNLDALEVILIPNLVTLGQQHANIKGFKHEYFEIFFKAMDITWKKFLGMAYDLESRTAWTKIFRLIVAKVEQGYFEGVDMNTRRTSEQIDSMEIANVTDHVANMDITGYISEDPTNGDVSEGIDSHVDTTKIGSNIAQNTLEIGNSSCDGIFNESTNNSNFV